MLERIAKSDKRLRERIIKQELELANGCQTYLMFDGRYYKIGKSKNPEKRLLEIKTGNPGCELICSSNKITEIELHTLFYNSNVGREWFDLQEQNEIDTVIDLILNGRKSGSDSWNKETKKNKMYSYSRTASTNEKVLISNRKKKSEDRKKKRENRIKKEDYTNYIITFGKYKDRLLSEMNSIDELNYISWFVSTKEMKKEFDYSYRAFKWKLEIIK